MTLRQLKRLIGCLPALLLLSACGNKGDLFLIPDPVSQMDIEQFQRVLEVDEVPLAEPQEVDDEKIFVDPDKRKTDRPATDTDTDTSPVE